MRLLFFPFLHFSRTQLQRHLAGKTVLITGASYGVGRCLAEQLGETSAHLLLVARTEAKLLEVQQCVRANGGTADIFPCDLRNADEVNVLLDRLQQLSSGIDIFVSNAGKSIRRSIFDSLDRPHDFTRTMNLNYFAPVQLMLGLIPGLVERQGQVINISAVNVLLIPVPQWAAYQASKTAFDQWFRCVSPELNARGVSTTSIYLPLVRTRMIEPTQAYRNLPAMQPEQVAQLICKAMLSRQHTYAPWWLMLGQFVSVLFRGVWEVATSQYLRRYWKRKL
ncbi:MAG TPA: SDR family NAD(P)-dependent oxidoreductase [Leptolyngbyaceae cyanobacterium M33_DOE_097]|uniref:SDR family NAD(P)-dependent oxidoreductase n=1 Tax=Oscillatoriales cyanobacterium SpSt-418 TaxID=2282169 RepID=A0A7C3PDZ6_9CYAN|nr:SDR family NAD(P)-dependent oxidoreductase [Leptolyngbyaceae cyanobacterium M33_DOE_097]